MPNHPPMRLSSYHTIGRNKNAPRLFLESNRLTDLGFSPGTLLSIENMACGQLVLKPSSPHRPAGLRKVKVCSRRVAGSLRPVIDLNSYTRMANFANFSEARVTGSFRQICIRPSQRAFNIATSKAPKSKYRVLDLCCGGGTTSQAAKHPKFQIVAGVEINPVFADEYAAQHPDAEIIIGDLRMIHPSEYPDFDGIFCGIPCTFHSLVARAKKGLSGKPELGDTGDLYISLLSLIAARMPSFVVLENVPSYGTSLAGETVKLHLKKLGYHVTDANIDPLNDYAEPSTRDRWICIGLLAPGFTIPNPHTPFTGTINDFLDLPDANKDKKDALRIRKTVKSLKRHTAKHKKLGHGFAIKVTTRSDTSIPTILKSYHKINTSGAFLSTPYGERMIRPNELCRIHGHDFITTDPTSIYQMSGQGVQTRIFRTIFDSLADFLP